MRGEGRGRAPAWIREVVEGTRLEIGFGRRKASIGCEDAEKDPFSEGRASMTKGVGASGTGFQRAAGFVHGNRGAPREARSTGGEADRSMTDTLPPVEGPFGGSRHGGRYRSGIGCSSSGFRAELGRTTRGDRGTRVCPRVG